MAGDWIKMRTDLYRDPKVCVMADFLLSDDGELARYVNQNMQRDIAVTRNVMRNVTVGALVSVWGVLRHRGKRVDGDLLVKGCTLSVIDDVADLPGFGVAMESVGWAIETDAGIVFPRFFDEFNVDPEEDAKKKNAERQRRYRENQKQESNVTRDVTVTSESNVREEKRREELKPSSSDRPDDGFALFWKTYPRKVGKGAAQKAWKKIKPDPDVQQDILIALGWQRTADQWTKDGGQFIPHPSTWLNEQRWLDEQPGKPADAIPFDRAAYEAKRKAELAAAREAYMRQEAAATVPIAGGAK